MRSRIEAAATRSGRAPDDVTLVVVTKTVPASVISLLPALGVLHVGENRLQQALPKIEALGPGLHWHLIGHLQRNKARRAVEHFELLHSVSSLKLARTLDRLAGERGRPVRALLQVNISGEPQKHGVEPDEVRDFLGQVAGLEGFRLEGFMGMAAFLPDPEEARPGFSLLRRIRDEANEGSWYRIPLADLSMGMTNDFEVAVEEGATMVRVGTAVFSGVDPELVAGDFPKGPEDS